MTQAKKLKKTIRARARKTGESYTAARRHVLLSRKKRPADRGTSTAARVISPRTAGQERPKPQAQPAAPGRPGEPRRAAKKDAPAAGGSKAKGAVSAAAAVKKTGHDLAHWFEVLDAFDHKKKGHTDRALYLYEEHGVPGWYAQGITVAYERARGMRVMNQSCTGDFQVSVTRTVPVSVAEVAAAIGDPRRRAEWLRGADDGLRRALETAFTGPKARTLTLKNANSERERGEGTGRRPATLRANYARLRYPWDGAPVEIRVQGKKTGSSVVADNSGLPRAELVEERRRQWRLVLESLQRHLGR